MHHLVILYYDLVLGAASKLLLSTNWNMHGWIKKSKTNMALILNQIDLLLKESKLLPNIIIAVK